MICFEFTITLNIQIFHIFSPPENIIVETINKFCKDFLNSPLLISFRDHQKWFAGILLCECDAISECVVFHNTPLFPFAYSYGSSAQDYKVRKAVSRLESGACFKCDSFVMH